MRPDKYTPHGYLDNPAYAWILGKGGILRSRPALGMEWHYPALPASYNPVRQYHTAMRLAFEVGGRWLLDTADFREAGVELYCDYHSKNLLRFVCRLPNGVRVSASFFLVDRKAGDGLACLVRLENTSSQPASQKVAAMLEYECDPEHTPTWLSGLYTRADETGLVIGEWQEGVKVHLAVSFSPQRHGEHGVNPKESSETNVPALSPVVSTLSSHPVSSAVKTLVPFSASSASSAVNKWQRALGTGYEVTLAAGASQEHRLVLVRAPTELQARTHAQVWLADDGSKLQEVLTTRLNEDKSFWRNAPRLYGDWPGYVRRGLVYDLETLRMMVRRPLGIYQHAWDAMQLQAPRTVLGEAALDMAILAYADPDAAKAVLLGTFADAPEPNVPCSREDGSYNMVASDGSPCGTAPEWCFPFHCINLVYQQTGDKTWLSELYPYLEAFVSWWLTQRTNSQGLPFYKCSWEAGQDNSPRFGIKDDPSGGGALTEHLWPVDLQAALAQCCLLLAYWAGEIGQDGESWQKLGHRYAELTRSMWQPEQSWFHDYDTRAARFTEVLDTMQLAPLLCGVADAGQKAALVAKIADPPKHGQIFHPLMWPSIAFGLIEAAGEGGYVGVAAQHSWHAINAVYRWLDSDPLSIEPESGGVPGVGREYWPQVVSPDANPAHGGGGAEGYGWGCLTALLLCRHIVGLSEAFDLSQLNQPRAALTSSAPVQAIPDQATTAFAFKLTPGLPPELLQTNSSYGAGPLRYQKARFKLRYRVTNAPTSALELRLVLGCASPLHLNVTDAAGKLLYQSAGALSLHRLLLAVTNHQSLYFHFN